jgi:hypothetical protein
LAHRAMDAVTDEKLEACTAPQAALVFGIAVDKAQALENSGLRGVSAQDTVTSVLQELEAIRARRLEVSEEQS